MPGSELKKSKEKRKNIVDIPYRGLGEKKKTKKKLSALNLI